MTVHVNHRIKLAHSQ